MPHQVPIKVDSRTRRRYLYANSFELLVAILSIFASVGFFLNPDALGDSSLGRVFHPWDYIWNIMYGLSAFAIVCGLVRVRPRIEIGGLVLLMASVLLQAWAVAVIRGLTGLASIAIFIAVVLACGARARIILTGVPTDRGIVIRDRKAEGN